MTGRLAAVVLALLGAFAALVPAPPGAAAAELPRGFSDRVAFGSLAQPTSLAFAPDGRVFVAEKRGTLVAFDGLADAKSQRVADLRTSVHSFYERGLLSVAVDPEFPDRPYVYVGYTHDAPRGGVAPAWGLPGGDLDDCLPGDPDPSFESGCAVSSRVSRLTIGPDGTSVGEEVLVEDWCQQFPSHSIGDLEFDRSGALLAGGGDGAYFGGTDLGTRGDPAQACGDPEGEGGALRAQDLVTDTDPVGLAGTIIRINPRTGAAAPGNPIADVRGNGGRIVAYGLRNPFRFAMRPGSDELFVGDVGWATDEEINLLDVATAGSQINFGWPCFEGTAAQPAYAAEGSSICSTLYAEANAFAPPWYGYRHGESVVPGDRCPEGGGPSAITGIDFESGSGFPAPYDDALFFADYTRNCIWSMPASRLGMPDRAATRAFASEVDAPIDLVAGPEGLYYPDLFGGAIRRIAYVRPTTELRLRSKPPGVELRVGDRVERAPTTITLAAGSRHPVSAPRLVRIEGARFAFARWSDGGPRRQTVRANGAAELTAIYACARPCTLRGESDQPEPVGSSSRGSPPAPSKEATAPGRKNE